MVNDSLFHLRTVIPAEREHRSWSAPITPKLCDVTMVIDEGVGPRGSGTKLSDPAGLVGYLWSLKTGLHAVTDRWPRSRLSAHPQIWRRGNTGEFVIPLAIYTRVDEEHLPTNKSTDLSSKAFSSVRQATKVLLVNMWHMTTWRHRSMKVSVAKGSKVPLRKMRQRRCRREQQDRASKNDALAFR